MLNKRPIVAVTDTDGKFMVLGGNMRLRACIDLKMKEVPVIIADEWTEEQRREFIIKDNVGFGEWDWDQLANEWDAEQLAEWGLDLPVDFGAETNEGLTDPDEVPEVPETPITVLGDVWVLGKHRVMCGDSTSKADVSKLMGGQKADMVFTDPPYALFGNSTGVAVADDNMVRSFFRDVLLMLKMNSKLFAHIYVCCDWHSAFAIEAVSRQVELKPKNLCIWDKGDGGVGAMYQQCYEMIWFFDNSPTQKTTMNSGKTGVKTVNGKPNIWRVKRHTTGRVHNAQKPVDLVNIPMLAGSDGGDCVLDLFGGSGTTAISAEINGRKSLLMELAPKYCDVIVKRWQDFTGQQAIHEASGKTFTELTEAQVSTV